MPNLFDNVINEDAVEALTDEQATLILAMLTKAGY